VEDFGRTLSKTGYILVHAATMMFSDATAAARRPAPELQPHLTGGILRRPVPPTPPAPQPRATPTPPAPQPRAISCRPRRSSAPSPRRLRSSPAPCSRSRSCLTPPCEDATAERERIEEKGYGRERERRGCGMKIRKKEEKG
jgi:hypothetical protein